MNYWKLTVCATKIKIVNKSCLLITTMTIQMYTVLELHKQWWHWYERQGLVSPYRYSSCLGEARDFGIKKGVMSGLGMGFFQIMMFGSYALAFW